MIVHMHSELFNDTYAAVVVLMPKDVTVKLKAKVTLEQATKAQMWSRRTALPFLQTRRYMVVGGQHHAPSALPLGKTRYPLYRRLGGPQDRSGRVGKTRPHRDSIPGPSSP